MKTAFKQHLTPCYFDNQQRSYKLLLGQDGRSKRRRPLHMMPLLNPITDHFMTFGDSSTLKEGKQVSTLQSTAYSISSMFGTTLQGKDNRVGSQKGLD